MSSQGKRFYPLTARNNRRKSRASRVTRLEQLEARELLVSDLVEIQFRPSIVDVDPPCLADGVDGEDCAPVARTTGPYVELQGHDIQLHGMVFPGRGANAEEGLSFHWLISLGDKELQKTGASPLVSAAELDGVSPGEYSVQLTVENAKGVQGTTTTDLVIFPNPCSLEVVTADDGLGQGTLRHAVICSNLSPGPDTIRLPGDLGVFSLTARGVGEDKAMSGDLDVTSPASAALRNELFIVGNGENGVVIDASSLGDRIFDVHSHARVSLENLQIIGGTAVDQAGGGALQNKGGTVSISNSTLRNNRAQQGGSRGGAIANHVGAITITDSTISGNTAGQAGGGLWNNSRATMTIEGTTISGNTAAKPGQYDGRGGGGIFNNGGTLTISNATINDNAALGRRSNGGGIANRQATITITGAKISGNTASQEGGGLWNDARSEMTITGTSISGNTAGQEGGGLWNGVHGELTIDGGEISGNTASSANNTTSRGGGGVFNNGGTVTISNATITDNQALGVNGNGGGIASRQATITITGAKISGNTATHEGGGLWNDARSEMTITGTSISGNTAGQEGGGLWNGVQSEMTIDGSSISGNTASAANRADSQGGGGVFNSRGTLTITSSTISGNTANRGGGIESESGTVELSTSLMIDNSGGSAGGGIHSTDDELKILRTTLSKNTAPVAGGLRIAKPAILYVENSTISGNESSESTADVWIATRADAASNLLNVTVFADSLQVEGPLQVENTILSQSECTGRGIISLGHNLDEGGTCNFQAEGDVVGVRALLSPLADHGGPQIGDPREPQSLLTHAISFDSPAVDSASNNAPAFDQRGVERPVGAADMGAFELMDPQGAASRAASNDELRDAPAQAVTSIARLRSTFVDSKPSSSRAALLDAIFESDGHEQRRVHARDVYLADQIVESLFAGDSGPRRYIS